MTEVETDPRTAFDERLGFETRLTDILARFVRLRVSLCANMDETLPPSECRVEGGEGRRDEYPA